MNQTIISRVDALRVQMALRGLDALVVPATDPHQGEYMADHWQSRRWLTGFGGSAGTAVVTADTAGLWTDSRYFLEAEARLADTGIELHRTGNPDVLDYPLRLANRMQTGNRVGVDGRLISVTAYRNLEAQLRGCGTELVCTDDLFADIWSDRPPIPDSPARLLDDTFTGRSRAQKIEDLRRTLSIQGVSHYLVAALDDIAWLLNLRGSDVPFNPLVHAYVLGTPDEVVLCMDRTKLAPDDQRALERDGIRFEQYDRIVPLLGTLPNSARLFLDPARTGMELFLAVPIECGRIEQRHVIVSWKAIKNPTEQNHIRACMVRDGVALERFFFWLEASIGKQDLSEQLVVEKLREFRGADDRYVGDSFQTIAGFGPDGAIVHYSVTPESNLAITPDNLLLLDSGAHYLDGTTDITRVVAIGNPTAQQRTDFTLVLKAHIALAVARFPAGTAGHRLDTIARSVLWQAGCNYGHGTGHGVGFFLNVHEGPQKIAAEPNDSAMMPGMLTSNEPGLYRPGQYGIRVENLVLTQPDADGDFGPFLKFETVSLCHLDRRLIDVSMLSEEERVWVNDYHARVFNRLSPGLEQPIVGWLEARTAPL